MKATLLISFVAVALLLSNNGADAVACTGSKRIDCRNYDVFRALEEAGCGVHADSENVKMAFAVIGDYGYNAFDPSCADQVSKLVSEFEKKFTSSKEQFFILTTGDNNYNNGSCTTIEDNTYALYSSYFEHGNCVEPQSTTSFSPQSMTTQDEHSIRFYPSLGNHDWDTFKNANASLPYFQYFNYLSKLRGGPNGQYYAYRPANGSVEFFALNSNLRPDAGAAWEKDLYAKQRSWIQSALKNSTAIHKIVFFHHAPFSTSRRDAIAPWMDLPFQEWGATAVFNGHHHTYERIDRGIPYIINGLGGNPFVYDIADDCDSLETGSAVRYNAAHGAMIGLVSEVVTHVSTTYNIDFCFFSLEQQGVLVDTFALSIEKEFPPVDNTESARAVLAIGIIFLLLVAGIAGYLIRRRVKKLKAKREQQQTAQEWAPQEDDEAGKRLAIGNSEQ